MHEIYEVFTTYIIHCYGEINGHVWMICFELVWIILESKNSKFVIHSFFVQFLNIYDKKACQQLVQIIFPSFFFTFTLYIYIQNMGALFSFITYNSAQTSSISTGFLAVRIKFSSLLILTPSFEAQIWAFLPTVITCWQDSLVPSFDDFLASKLRTIWDPSMLGMSAPIHQRNKY